MRLSLLILSSYALFFTLPGYMEFCFTIDGKESSKIWGAYIVSGSEDTKVLTRLFDANRKTLYTSSKSSREGKFETAVTVDQIYELCFKALDFSEKSISFEFSQESQIEEFALAKDDQFEPLNDDIQNLVKNLDTVYRNIHFYERRERVHRDLAEKTCDDLLWSVLIKIAVLCVLSLSQIYALKGFFTDKIRV